MPKGQAETLFPILEEFLAWCKWGWPDVDAIGVATGPGNFTGIRIGVSAARGLGLALKIPVFGITQFELASDTIPMRPRTLLSVPAPRGMAYVHGVETGALAGQSLLVDPSNPPTGLLSAKDMEVRGFRATEIASPFDAYGFNDAYEPDPGRMADITEAKYLDATAFPPPPAPNYVKAPDAAPASDTPPRIIA